MGRSGQLPLGTGAQLNRGKRQLCLLIPQNRDNAEQYRRFARKCMELVNRFGSAGHRAMLLEWRRLGYDWPISTSQKSMIDASILISYRPFPASFCHTSRAPPWPDDQCRSHSAALSTL